ncbi:MAG: hypothetical protein JRN33_08055 [Nitrososphaerota archaeon]|jgi:HEPN domain-containing protein|nr:hypothetical protein [Nitrososphaerota archaeon]
MPATPTPTEAARTAVQSAQAHVDAAKLLTEGGFHGFATFHLLTAIEEVLKARLVGDNGRILLEVVAPPRTSARKSADQALFAHRFKIPVGVLLVMIQSGVLATVKYPKFEEGMPPDEVKAIKRKSLEDSTWLAQNVANGAQLREQAIYSGADRSGRIPDPVDWKAMAERLLPLVESQVEFAAWVVEQPTSTEELEAAKTKVAELLKSIEGVQAPSPRRTG